jgi:hypothetical protein
LPPAFNYRLRAGSEMLPIERRFVRSKIMSDIIFICVMAGFFGLAALYVRFCDKL